MRRPLCLVVLAASVAVAQCAAPPNSPDSPPPAAFPSSQVAPPPAAPPTLKVTRFMAFGDSLTEGEIPLPLDVFPDKAYPAVLLTQLQGRYPSQSFTMIDEGSGGHSAAADRQPSEEFPLGRFQTALIADQPQVLLLLQGIVDVRDEAQQTPEGIDALRDALRDDVRDAKARGVAVFLSTLTAEKPPLSGYKDQNYITNAAFMTDVNAAIRDVAAQEGATLVDGYAAIAADTTDFVGGDGLHLTALGYQALAAAFFDAIKAHYEIPGSVISWSRGPSIASVGADTDAGPGRRR